MRQQNRNLANAALVLAVVLALATAWGCASMTTNAYKVLASGKVAYQGAMNAAKDAHDQGIISDEQKEQVRDWGWKYWSAHQSASTALESWALGETDDAKSRLEVALQAASDALADLLDNWDKMKGGDS